MQTSTLALLGGGVVAVSVAAAVYLRPVQDQIRADRAAADVVELTTEVAVDALAVGPSDTASAEAEPAAEADAPEPMAEVASAEAPEPNAETQAAAVAPVLTTLRFEPDGAVLVSGTAEPLSQVAVMMDGMELERLDAGADGAFFFAGFVGFADAPRVLSVIGDPDGSAMPADRTFVLAANPAPEPELTSDVAVLAEETEADDPAPTASSESTAVEETVMADAPVEVPEVETSQEAPESAEVEAAETSPAVPAILAVTEEGVDVVQAPRAADASPEVMSTVALDTITYDASGDVQLRGRALGQGFVQVYVDNAPVSRLPVDETGNWRGDLPDVDKGVYTLRIDEIDAEGDVVSRIETPFLREDPDTVAEVMAEEVEDPTFTVATRTVQPGATLWAIAEERYGAGVLYVTVFEANRDRIRNPDLIYPGQVFVLPEGGNE